MIMFSHLLYLFTIWCENMTPLFMSFDITKSLEVYIGLKSNANLLSKRFKLGLFVSSLYDKKYSTQIMLLDEK